MIFSHYRIDHNRIRGVFNVCPLDHVVEVADVELSKQPN